MRIIFTTLIILVAYQIAIVIGVVSPGVGRDNFETNCISSESWRYKKHMPAVILVGSSKTNFIDYGVLGPDVFHLGYGGQGCLTGLEVLHHTNEIPSTVLVEVSDTLQWPADEKCVDLASKPAVIGDFVYSMQHRYEPIAVLLKSLGAQQIPDSETRAKLIAIQKEQLSIPFRPSKQIEVAKNIARAKYLIEELRSRGCNVVLFDIPVEKEIRDSQFVREASQFINAEFSSSIAYKLTYPTSEELHTRDGTHLLESSGTTYAIWLKDQLKEAEYKFRVRKGAARDTPQL